MFSVTRSTGTASPCPKCTDQNLSFGIGPHRTQFTRLQDPIPIASNCTLSIASIACTYPLAASTSFGSRWGQPTYCGLVAAAVAGGRHRKQLTTPCPARKLVRVANMVCAPCLTGACGVKEGNLDWPGRSASIATRMSHEEPFCKTLDKRFQLSTIGV